MPFAEVVVDIGSLLASAGRSQGASSGAFTYHIPEGLEVHTGQAVVVPLGKRTVAGVVARTEVSEPEFPTRPISAIVEQRQLVSPLQLALAHWMSERYRASVWDCVALFLPPGTTARLKRAVEGRLPRTRALLGEQQATSEQEVAPSALLPEQADAAARIVAAVEAPRHEVFLLHGVTGSGKTHVYLEAAKAALAAGRRVLILVSEIIVTQDALRRVEAQFPGRAVCLHSGLTPSARRQSWERIWRGDAQVVVGPRSALFAPASPLGLIVIDEEHEWTYKSEMSPRYHARDVAVELARLAGIPLVLSSATPDVWTCWQANRGRFQSLQLPRRFAGGAGLGKARPSVPMPGVRIVDLRAELRSGNTSLLSRELQRRLRETLERREQAILFINRRGAATCVTCRDCGHVMICRRCGAPLVQHARAQSFPTPTASGASGNAVLVCHLCNRRREPPERCPSCGGPRMRYLGVGTQRLEQQVRALFPSARLARWDRDAFAGALSYEQHWQEFAEGRADILIGTQLVAKALDVPRVTLVGVVLADTGLYLPDFRAAERSFQLLTQVAGRAGRGQLHGEAIVQTYTPEHYAITCAARHDYRAFYEHEIAFRRQNGYPPFSRLAILLFSHSSEPRCWREAGQVRRWLSQRIRDEDLTQLRVLGPVPAFHRRLRGRYRWQLLLLGDDFGKLLAQAPLGPGWTVDVDPASIL